MGLEICIVYMQPASYHRNKQVELFGGRLSFSGLALCTLRTALRRYQPWEWGGRIMHSLTHAGRNVVQAGLQSAAALLCAVSDVCLQEGNAKLPLVHHADQAAAGLARALPCSSKQTRCTHTGTDLEFTQRSSVFNIARKLYTNPPFVFFFSLLHHISCKVGIEYNPIQIQITLLNPLWANSFAAHAAFIHKRHRQQRYHNWTITVKIGSYFFSNFIYFWRTKKWAQNRVKHALTSFCANRPYKCFTLGI